MIKLLVTFITLNCCSLVFSQPIPFEPDTNTVGLWHFNEGSGDITYDTSGNNLNGTVDNGDHWAVVYGYSNDGIFVLDSSRSRFLNQWGYGEFIKRWAGNCNIGILRLIKQLLLFNI